MGCIMADEHTRQKPNDINAEAAVLSAMMLDNLVVAKAIENLEVDNFYRKAHQIIFKNIVELFQESVEVDIITLIDKLSMNVELEKVGGEPFINELSDVVMSGVNAEFHINIVLEKALLRQLIDTSTKIVESCYRSDQPVEDIVDTAEQSITAGL